ncbi:5853_t:CDS:2, partial [Ambispora leptoticha]
PKSELERVHKLFNTAIELLEKYIEVAYPNYEIRKQIRNDNIKVNDPSKIESMLANLLFGLKTEITGKSTFFCDEIKQASNNARIHHATDSCRKVKLSTIAELARKKKIELVYLPGYSPKLNPVEKCFSVIKNYYRQQRPRTERQLRRVIKEAIAKIQQLDLTKTFKSCFSL